MNLLLSVSIKGLHPDGDSEIARTLTRNLFNKYEGTEIFSKICKGVLDNEVYLCFTRRKPKAGAMMDRLASSEYNFYFPRDVGRKFLEELPATIDFIQHLLTKEIKSHPKDISRLSVRDC